MLKKVAFTLIAMFMLSMVAACTQAAPEAAPDTTASQAPTAAPAEETPTAVPEEEAAAMETESSDEEATYVVDTAASELVWFGSKPVGSSETGTIEITEGEMTFVDNQLVSGQYTIDMTTITPTGLNERMTNMLTDHLTSDDFFGVETHPTASLVLKSAEPTDVENQYLVTADLTIKEITNEITFTTDVTVADDSLTATADIVFDRAAFDVQYGSGSFFDNLGDDLISDEIEMTVSLVTKRA